MPDFADIEQFKSSLNAVAREEEILEERGEVLEDVAPPEEGLSDDLSMLLGDAEDVGTSDAAVDDFSDLGDLVVPDVEEAATESPPEIAGDAGPSEDDSGIDAFDIDGIFPEEESTAAPAESAPEETAVSDIEAEITDAFDGLDFTSEDAEPEAAEAEEPETPAAEQEQPFAEESVEGISEEEYGGLTEGFEGFDDVEGIESESIAESEPDVDDIPADADVLGDLSFEEPSTEDTELSEVDIPRETDDGLDDFTLPEGLDFEDVIEEEGPPAAEPGAGDFEVDDSEIEDVEADEFDAETSGTEKGEAEEFTVPEEFAFDEEPAAEAEEAPLDEVPADVEEAASEAAASGEEAFELPEEFTFEDDEAGIDTGPEAEEEPEAQSAGTDGSFGEEAETVSEPDEVGEDDFELDDFSLGDIGEQFGITDEETAETAPAEEELNPALAISAELPAEEMELQLSDEEFEDLQTTLSGLPRNLRIIIEELIGEQQLSGENLDTLVDALVTGRSPKEIAVITGRITGQRISIPEQYEKKTGVEFEAEIGTFAYTFKHNILPILRTLIISLAAVGIIGLLLYQLAYRPIRAAVLYNRGYNELTEGRFLPANDNFYRATDSWKMKKRFYQYADGFTEMNRDDLAAEKYEELLASYPNDRRGILDYANFEIYERARYQHAEDLLDSILAKDLDNYDALLLNGDMNMVWALEDPSRYEQARLSYATLIQEYGNRDQLLFRMLRYFIRTDNMSEVLSLKDYFQESEKIEIDPSIYAELGGYLVTNDTLSDVQSVLFRAMEADTNLPEIHYNLARFFKKVERPTEERKALINAYRLLTGEDKRTVEHEKMLIDTINRQGEAYYNNQEFLDAEKKYIEAISLYEDGLERNRLTPDSQFGKVYSNLGDIYYYISGDYSSAGIDYRKAEQNGYNPPVLKYKIGAIEYLDDNFEDALLRFHTAAGDYSTNVNLMYSTANAFFNRNDYGAAQGYYLHVLDILETQRRNIPILRIDERRDHRALVENLMKVNNNLGVTLYYLSRQTGDTKKVSQGLVNLTRSSELYDQLSRDDETLVRSVSKNLSFINMRAILYPESEFGLEIYRNVPRDFVELEF